MQSPLPETNPFKKLAEQEREKGKGEGEGNNNHESVNKSDQKPKQKTLPEINLSQSSYIPNTDNRTEGENTTTVNAGVQNNNQVVATPTTETSNKHGASHESPVHNDSNVRDDGEYSDVLDSYVDITPNETGASGYNSAGILTNDAFTPMSSSSSSSDDEDDRLVPIQIPITAVENNDNNRKRNEVIPTYQEQSLPSLHPIDTSNSRVLNTPDQIDDTASNENDTQDIAEITADFNRFYPPITNMNSEANDNNTSENVTPLNYNDGAVSGSTPQTINPITQTVSNSTANLQNSQSIPSASSSPVESAQRPPSSPGFFQSSPQLRYTKPVASNRTHNSFPKSPEVPDRPPLLPKRQTSTLDPGSSSTVASCSFYSNGNPTLCINSPQFSENVNVNEQNSPKLPQRPSMLINNAGFHSIPTITINSQTGNKHLYRKPPPALPKKPQLPQKPRLSTNTSTSASEYLENFHRRPSQNNGISRISSISESVYSNNSNDGDLDAETLRSLGITEEVIKEQRQIEERIKQQNQREHEIISENGNNEISQTLSNSQATNSDRDSRLNSNTEQASINSQEDLDVSQLEIPTNLSRSGSSASINETSDSHSAVSTTNSSVDIFANGDLTEEEFIKLLPPVPKYTEHATETEISIPNGKAIDILKINDNHPNDDPPIYTPVSDQLKKIVNRPQFSQTGGDASTYRRQQQQQRQLEQYQQQYEQHRHTHHHNQHPRLLAPPPLPLRRTASGSSSSPRISGYQIQQTGGSLRTSRRY